MPSAAGDEQERLRRDYEFKIATMQNRITGLERDLEQRELDTQQTVHRLEEELDGFRKRAEEHGSAMKALQRELDDIRDLRAREKDREARRAQADEEELQILRERCERLEEERSSGFGIDNGEIIEQLRADMEGLMSELSDLSRRNDELMTAKDSDLTVIRDLDSQLKEYKRKYEQAKTELRSVKATSQLFLQAPKMEDQLPTGPDGGLIDIHVTAFVSAIDSLLTAGRASAPTRVLVPMKAVVTSTTAIIDDVRAYEQRPSRADVDVDILRTLRERAEATLTNLVAASKTHATASGMSPVSLLDAAASHVSVTLTEIAKMIYIRKASRAEQEEFMSSSSSGSLSYISPARSTEEVRPSFERKGSTYSTRRSEDVVSPPMTAASRFAEAHSRRTPSEQSSSPPPMHEKSPITSALGATSDDSAPPEGGEDAWSELKPYLEAQTESIVYAIQSVLSGVRSPVPPPTLNENLTQIITIVSSIVAVCSDNLPPASAQQGAELLRELGEHARKLSEVQTLPEVTKESRQVMAKSSFAVANAMKGLMKL
jgi:cell division septum initiation protein DivIVA